MELSNTPLELSGEASQPVSLPYPKPGPPIPLPAASFQPSDPPKDGFAVSAIGRTGSGEANLRDRRGQLFPVFSLIPPPVESPLGLDRRSFLLNRLQVLLDRSQILSDQSQFLLDRSQFLLDRSRSSWIGRGSC
jgi:hypothetical protein